MMLDQRYHGDPTLHPVRILAVHRSTINLLTSLMLDMVICSIVLT